MKTPYDGSNVMAIWVDIYKIHLNKASLSTSVIFVNIYFEFDASRNQRWEQQKTGTP